MSEKVIMKEKYTMRERIK